MTFGRNPNIPSTLSLPTELTYDSLLRPRKRQALSGSNTLATEL